MSHFGDEFLQQQVYFFVLELRAEVVNEEEGVFVVLSVLVDFVVDVLEGFCVNCVIDVLAVLFFETAKYVVFLCDGVDGDFGDDCVDVVMRAIEWAFQHGEEEGGFSGAHPG